MADFIIPNNEATALIKAVNLQPVQVLDYRANVVPLVGAGAKLPFQEKPNPYQGKLDSKYTADEVIATSSLGTPILTDLTIKGVKYTDYNGRIVELKNDRYRSGAKESNGASNSGGFYMTFETVLITATKPKRIIKTEIQGRDGTVKEYIGASDTELDINIIITGKNRQYPREEVNRFVRWLDAPVTKEVTAWWLDNIGVSNIVIDDYSMPQVAGGYSYQIFQIKASSDTPAELKITQTL